MELQKDLVKGGFHSTYSMCQQATASSASNSASDFDAKKALGWSTTCVAPYSRVDELHCLLIAILGQGNLSNLDLVTSRVLKLKQWLQFMLLHNRKDLRNLL